MEPNQTAITGTEDQGNLATPYQALVQFYEGFNRCDMSVIGMTLEITEGCEGNSHDLD